MRWTWKRWVWSVVAGTAIAAAGVNTAGAELPKAGDTITLSFPGQPERKVTVVKATKKPDGSIETEVKDSKTGETFTILDEAPDAKSPTPPAGAKAPAPPAPAKSVASVPVRPAAAPTSVVPRAVPTPNPAMPATPAMAAAKPEKSERRFFGRLFSRDKDKGESRDVPAMPASADEGNRRGLLDRIFGRKSDPSPAQPEVMAAPAATRPLVVPSVPNSPAATPPTTGSPTSTPSTPSTPSSTGEPPRVMPPKPSSSIPLPLPAKPVVPSSPPQSRRPARPGEPVQVILPVGYVPAQVAMAEAIKPFASGLANDPSPSGRMIAARGLAQGRYASSDEVKALLFQAAQSDPCPTVRADCMNYLCRLGYYDPAFLAHLRIACDDASEEVRDAAKAALARLTPSRK